MLRLSEEMKNQVMRIKIYFCCCISQFLNYKKYNKMIEIEHYEKLLTLLKAIEDDQNININIQRKPWPLNGVDAASQENIDMYR